MAAALGGGTFAHMEEHRLLGLAVLVSIMLHAALLFAFPSLREARKMWLVPGLMTARLVAPTPPAAPLAALLQPQAVKPAAIAKVAPQFAVAPPVAHAPILSIEPARQVVEPPKKVVEPAKLVAESTFVVPAAPQVLMVPQTLMAPQAPVRRAEPQPPAQAASGPDPGAIARFRLELMELARRHKKYPRIAQDNNWQGRVELRIMIAEDGAIASLVVKKGAGHGVLDDEAQAMLRTAKSKATIPPGLRGQAFALEIAVDFFLKDEER